MDDKPFSILNSLCCCCCSSPSPSPSPSPFHPSLSMDVKDQRKFQRQIISKFLSKLWEQTNDFPSRSQQTNWTTDLSYLQLYLGSMLRNLVFVAIALFGNWSALKAFRSWFWFTFIVSMSSKSSVAHQVYKLSSGIASASAVKTQLDHRPPPPPPPLSLPAFPSIFFL